MSLLLPVLFRRSRGNMLRRPSPATIPGMVLFHDGQFEGRTVKVPVQLGRRPHEEANPRTHSFYVQLLSRLCSDVFRTGEWKLLEARPAWHDNPTWMNFLVSWWEEPGQAPGLW